MQTFGLEVGHLIVSLSLISLIVFFQFDDAIVRYLLRTYMDSGERRLAFALMKTLIQSASHFANKEAALKGLLELFPKAPGGPSHLKLSLTHIGILPICWFC